MKHRYILIDFKTCFIIWNILYWSIHLYSICLTLSRAFLFWHELLYSVVSELSGVNKVREEEKVERVMFLFLEM